MYLLIDLSEKDLIHLVWFGEEARVDKNYEGMNKDLLLSIDTFFCDLGVSKSGVHGIIVVVGTGGFTSTRLAVTVANTFGYVMQIPLLTINVDQVSIAQSLIPELLKQPAGQYISATYSGEPNIGVSG